MTHQSNQFRILPISIFFLTDYVGKHCIYSWYLQLSLCHKFWELSHLQLMILQSIQLRYSNGLFSFLSTWILPSRIFLKRTHTSSLFHRQIGLFTSLEVTERETIQGSCPLHIPNQDFTHACMSGILQKHKQINLTITSRVERNYIWFCRTRHQMSSTGNDFMAKYIFRRGILENVVFDWIKMSVTHLVLIKLTLMCIFRWE
jgi:hypothetical protein